MIDKAKQRGSLIKDELYQISIYKNNIKTKMTLALVKNLTFGKNGGFVLMTTKFVGMDGKVYTKKAMKKARRREYTLYSDAYTIPLTLPILLRAKAVCHLPADEARLSKRKSASNVTCDLNEEAPSPW